jgi:hypothetical protein
VPSADRVCPITEHVGVSASGNSVPPLFTLPPNNYRDYFIASRPDGSTSYGG